MGNRISGALRKPAVEERLTRPQRLLRQPSGMDYKKLRKLILARRLAPCFDALDEASNHQCLDLEECPICFFYYPCLNRSRCCSKGICTECFLQMKPSDANNPVQIAVDRNVFLLCTNRCPFCKTSCYAVEYRGARSEEEKEQQQAEEQKVIEAKLRMQCESQNAMLAVPSCGAEVREMSDLRSTPMQENNGLDCSQDACNNRNRGLCVNLDEIMVMEAIWDSLQDFRLSKRGENRISGSSDIVGLESLTNGMDARTCSPSFSEVSSTDPQPLGVEVASSRLLEQNLLRSYSTEQNCERNQPVLNPHGSCSAESERRPSLIECLALPLDSDED